MKRNSRLLTGFCCSKPTFLHKRRSSVNTPQAAGTIRTMSTTDAQGARRGPVQHVVAEEDIFEIGVDIGSPRAERSRNSREDTAEEMVCSDARKRNTTSSFEFEGSILVEDGTRAAGSVLSSPDLSAPSQQRTKSTHTNTGKKKKRRAQQQGAESIDDDTALIDEALAAVPGLKSPLEASPPTQITAATKAVGKKKAAKNAIVSSSPSTSLAEQMLSNQMIPEPLRAPLSTIVDPSVSLISIADVCSKIATDAKAAEGDGKEGSGERTLLEQFRHEVPAPVAATVATALAVRGVRNEPLLYAAAWNVLKAPLPSAAETKGLVSSEERKAYAAQLAEATSTVFTVMTEVGLTHDYQLMTQMLGRCVELTPAMSFTSVSKVWKGLRWFNRMHFSAAEANRYHANDVEENNTLKDPRLQAAPLSGVTPSHVDSGVDAMMMKYDRSKRIPVGTPAASWSKPAVPSGVGSSDETAARSRDDAMISELPEAFEAVKEGADTMTCQEHSLHAVQQDTSAKEPFSTANIVEVGDEEDLPGTGPESTNLVEILADSLESRISSLKYSEEERATGDDGEKTLAVSPEGLLSPLDVLGALEGMTTLGVRDPQALKALASVVDTFTHGVVEQARDGKVLKKKKKLQRRMPLQLAVEILLNTAKIHERVVDILEASSITRSHGADASHATSVMNSLRKSSSKDNSKGAASPYASAALAALEQLTADAEAQRLDATNAMLQHATNGDSYNGILGCGDQTNNNNEFSLSTINASMAGGGNGIQISFDDSLTTPMEQASAALVRAASRSLAPPPASSGLAPYDFHHIARHRPDCIVSLRQVCETCPLVLQEVPSLWESIRGLVIPSGTKGLKPLTPLQNIGELSNGGKLTMNQPHSRFGSLGEKKFKTFKKVSVTDPDPHSMTHVPKQFVKYTSVQKRKVNLLSFRTKAQPRMKKLGFKERKTTMSKAKAKERGRWGW